jgi:peptidoglycan/LPS O-acetylase OafA/YrhL
MRLLTGSATVGTVCVRSYHHWPARRSGGRNRDENRCVSLMGTNVHHQVDLKHISYFQGLNSLRAIAALLVVMHHSERIKAKIGLSSFEWLGLFRNGGNAVMFFFVLSGFLITYLLLKEHDRKGSISIRSFYLKRAFRIWPLYYLLVVIGTILLPFALELLHVEHEMPYTLGGTWFYFVFFMPVLVNYIYGHNFLEPLWSIGVEEVFYLLWAPLFRFARKYLLWVLLGIIGLKLLLGIVGATCFKEGAFPYMMNAFRFEAMAIGGLGAYWFFHSSAPFSRSYIFRKPFQYLIIFITTIYMSFYNNIEHPIWIGIFRDPIYSHMLVQLLFLYTILCVACVDDSVIKLRSTVLDYLGEISYGMYMYHMLVIFVNVHLFKSFFAALDPVMFHLLFYTMIVLQVVLVSALSKHFFEDHFLRLKNNLL